MFFPKQVLAFQADMLAPFGFYDRENYDVLIEVQSADGSWETIDPETLVSLPRGKRTSLFLLAALSDEERTARFEEFASNLLTYLKHQRQPAQALRISLVTWPQSPDGQDAGRTPEATKTHLLVTVP